MILFPPPVGPNTIDVKATVANQAARYALTTATVQNGDTVVQTDTGVLYLVTDQTQLNGAGGYTALETVVDGQQLYDDTHSLFLDSGERKIYAPNGTDVWIDLSSEIDGVIFPIGFFSNNDASVYGQFRAQVINTWDGAISIGDDSGSAVQIFVSEGNGVINIGAAGFTSDWSYIPRGLFGGDGQISIGDGSGYAGSWDASGNLIAATIVDTNGYAFGSLFDGSGGTGTGATTKYAKYANTGFDDFFSYQSQSSSGSSNVFLQTDGTFSGTFRGIWFDQDDHQFVFNYGVLQPTSDSGFSSQDGLTYFDNSGFRGSISSRDGYTTLDDAGILVVFGSVTVGSGGAAINISPSGISGLSLLFAATSAFKLGGTDYYPHVAAGVLSFTSTP